jgi:hypothetical protein
MGQGGYVPVGDVGISVYDGRANFTISDRLNVPGATFRDRKFFRLFLNGTYTVNADGTGSTVLTNGAESTFVVTKSQVINGIDIAQEFFFILKDLDPTSGNLITDVGKRLPEVFDPSVPWQSIHSNAASSMLSS